VRYREAARKLVQLGCYELHGRGKGDHRWWKNPATNRNASLPDWGSKDLKTGTIRAVVRQLGLNWRDFVSA